MVIPPFAPRVKKESSHAFRKDPRGQTGDEWCKGGPKCSGGAFIEAQRKPLRRRGAQPPARASQRDSALDAQASIGERGTTRCSPDGCKPCGSRLRTAAADGRRRCGAAATVLARSAP